MQRICLFQITLGNKDRYNPSLPLRQIQQVLLQLKSHRRSHEEEYCVAKPWLGVAPDTLLLCPPPAQSISACPSPCLVTQLRLSQPAITSPPSKSQQALGRPPGLSVHALWWLVAGKPGTAGREELPGLEPPGSFLPTGARASPGGSGMHSELGGGAKFTANPALRSFNWTVPSIKLRETLAFWITYTE